MQQMRHPCAASPSIIWWWPGSGRGTWTPRRAVQLLIRATDLLDADDPRLPTALAWAARTATEQGDIERARALIDDAHRKALDQGDDLAIGFTQAWRASFLGTGRREEMARAVALLEKHPPGWQLASVLVGLAAMNMLEEHPQDARQSPSARCRSWSVTEGR